MRISWGPTLSSGVRRLFRVVELERVRVALARAELFLHQRPRLHAASVLVLGALLVAPGSLVSGDASSQYSAARLLCETGSPASEQPLDLFERGRQGLYWQAHDPGNLVLMMPAACASVLLVRLGLVQASEFFVLVQYAGHSLVAAGFGILGLVLIASAVSKRFGRRSGVLLAVGLLLGTPYVGYVRSSWDVMGAAVLLIAAATRLTRANGSGEKRDWIIFGCLLAGTLWFRYSLAASAGAFLLLLFIVDSRNRSNIFRAGFASGLALTPVLIYNFVRTGNFLVPGTLSEAYREIHSPSLSEIPSNLLALTFSPEIGLVWLAPSALLSVWIFGRSSPLPYPIRLSFGISIATYLLLITAVPNATAYGYGPRYLFPVLPLLFLAAFVASDAPSRRKVFWTLVGLGFFANAPALFIRWTAVRSMPVFLDSNHYNAVFSVEMWRSLGAGISTGQALGEFSDALSVVVPYTWFAQAMALIGIGRIWWWVALSLLASVLLGLVLAFVRADAALHINDPSANA